MCGIAGYTGRIDISEVRARDCLERMYRRGPDARGFFRHAFGERGKTLLLHTRLSIIDLDPRSDQPFRFRDKVLAFNGEIYNHVEVRKALSAQGRSFRTASDTEVLIQALDEWGVAGLDSLEGMWAFALYDESDGSLLLCRDRFGEKPLYILDDEDGIYFASEPKCIATLSGRDLEINYDQIRRYLVHGYKSLYKGRELFFRGLYQLPRAGWLRIDADGTHESGTYWHPGYAEDASMSYEEAVAGAREALIESVRLRLRADTPMAFCMSGGVDSNALISIAKRVFGYDVHGFTVMNRDARYNERKLVEASVAELGVRHTGVPVSTESFLDRLRQQVIYHDAPIATISYYVHNLLMQSVAEHGYKISVSGTAADELFTGYFDHHNAYLYEVSADEKLFKESLSNWRQHIGTIVRNPFLGDPEVFIKNPAQRGHVYLDADEYASCLTQEFNEGFREEHYRDGLLRNRMLNELFHEIIPVLLHEDDLNAMSHSVENRSPFLDRRLFEFCQRIPTRHLIRDGFNKKVLRDAMQGIEPEPILEERRKVGFNAPILDLFDRENSEVVAAVLDESPIFDLVKRDRIEAMLKRERFTNSASKFLFSFLSAKMFLEEFDTNSRREAVR